MRLSSVSHMGDRGLYGARVGFCWNHAIFWRSWYAVVGLPCAVRWVYAHGSRTEATIDIAFPHDSAISADAECARVCNTHTWDTRASVRASASWEFGMRAAPGPCRHQQTDTPVGSRCLHRPGARGHRGPRPSRRPPRTTPPDHPTRHTHPVSDVLIHRGPRGGHMDRNISSTSMTPPSASKSARTCSRRRASSR